MELLKKIAPHAIAVLIFVALSCIYFSPLFDGYSLKQSDVKQFQGMSKEIVDYRIQNGSEPLWTNSMFGGMPAYQVSVTHESNLLVFVDRFLKLGLPIPVGVLFISMLGFYIFGLCLRLSPWLSIVGAIAFGFSSFNILYIGAGHMTKVNAVAYMAPALGGMILAFRGKWLVGSIIFALFFGLNLTSNHLQITYYLGILLGAVAFSETIRLLVAKQFIDLGKTLGALVIAGVIAVLPSSSNLLTTYEYSKYTTRGATDLTIEPDGKKKDVSTQKGLNTDYILEYNYAPGEFLSVFIPNAKGGKDDYIGNNESAMEKLDSDYAEQVGQSSQYWGGQRFSGGAIYMGAIMFALFLLGLIFVKDTLKWPFLALGFVILFLVGKENFINDLFLNHFPMYNKFRDSKMILVILQVIVPAMGVLLIHGILNLKKDVINNDNERILTIKKEGKLLLGVCTGLSDYYKINKYLVRLLMFFTGGIFLYLLFWIIMADKSSNNKLVTTTSDNLIGKATWWVIGTGAILGLLAILYISPSIAGSFLKSEEIKQFSDAAGSVKEADKIEMINGIKSTLIDARKEIFKADIGRSFLFIGLVGLLLFLFLKNKIKPLFVITGIAVLVLIDQMSVSKRYLNNEEGDMGYLSYEEKQAGGLPYSPENGDKFILAAEKKSIANFSSLSASFAQQMKSYNLYESIEDDASLKQLADYSILGLNTDYRVFNFNNPFNETSTSYFHKSIGGYHGAKLKRYQEMIDFYIGNEMQTINRLVSQVKMEKLRTLDSLKIDSQEKAKAIFDTISITGMSLPDSTPILNMLNTKYILMDKSKAPIVNNQANGNAWFVSKVILANNANEEMKALKGFDSKNSVVVNGKETSGFTNELGKQTKQPTDKIVLTKYGTNQLTYNSDSKTSLPAVFSEIWYPEGWNCYIDGKKTDKIFRANYILRGAIIPAGKHKIEWKFEPTSYATGESLSLFSSILLLLLFGGVSFISLSKKEDKEKIEA
jgi:phage shock protein PspC (stress-responsive transcriptional regulator)